MLTLIFGFVRSKQDVKNGRKDHSSLLGDREGSNLHGSTLINELDGDRDPSFFDPPLEFYNENYAKKTMFMIQTVDSME